MVRLHARDDLQLGEARNVGGSDVLGVLDSEPPITGTILTLHSLEDIELQVDGAVSDRVNDNVQVCLISARGPGVEVLGCVDQQPRVVRRIGEWLKHRRGMRAERSVDESL